MPGGQRSKARLTTAERRRVEAWSAEAARVLAEAADDARAYADEWRAIAAAGADIEAEEIALEMESRAQAARQRSNEIAADRRTLTPERLWAKWVGRSRLRLWLDGEHVPQADLRALRASPDGVPGDPTAASRRGPGANEELAARDAAIAALVDAIRVWCASWARGAPTRLVPLEADAIISPLEMLRSGEAVTGYWRAQHAVRLDVIRRHRPSGEVLVRRTPAAVAVVALDLAVTAGRPPPWFRAVQQDAAREGWPVAIATHLLNVCGVTMDARAVRKVVGSAS